ncbi:hypothetical protein SLEP1_g48038 [Rubroshorea leprosula]|uniref:Uncharacterized protein n=1 Tax=Rubroshorea leprosula TaxID=152421 RepID=A0AAV5LSH6_9ROSI|nr:hypothetical protein SLEP1_g48038 [Rubroshorea leprosula]
MRHTQPLRIYTLCSLSLGRSSNDASVAFVALLELDSNVNTKTGLGAVSLVSSVPQRVGSLMYC